MSKLVNLKGKRFGRLKVMFRSYENHSSGQALWICVCDCGNETIVPGQSLREGRTKSCGCLHKDIIVTGINQRIHKKPPSEIGKLSGVIDDDFDDNGGYL